MSVIVIYAIVTSIFQVAFVRADYECLCNYNVEIPVFSKDSSASQVIGYMYEFDCKSTYAKVAKDSKFQPVQFENQVGYIENGNGLQIQICQGSVPIDDLVKTTTPSISTTTTKTTTAPQLVQTSSTSLPLVTERLTSSVTDPTTKVATISQQNATSSSLSTGVIVVISNGNITVLTNGTQDNNSTSKPSQLQATFSSIFTTSSTTSSSPIPLSTTSTITSQARASSTISTSTIHISSIQSSTAQSTTTLPLTTTASTIPPTTTHATTTTPSTPVATSTTTIMSSTTRVTSPTPSTSASTTQTSPTTKQRTTTTAPRPSCPNGWIMHTTSCYMFKTNDRRHWSDANSDCVSQKSHLAIIETADEFNFLKQQLDQRINTHDDDDPHTSAWVAGRDNNHEGTWEWYDGLTNTYKPFAYTHWGHDEPDSGDGEHEEDCMTMVGNEGFLWADYSCNENMFYVCEQSALPQITVQTQTTQTQSPPKQTNAATCPPGWIMNHGSCYLFHTDSREKWRHANSFCSQHQAHLVIIETSEEDRFLKQESSQRIHEDDDDSDSGVWVGGSDDDNEGHWEWIDGFSHTSKPMQGYSNWYPGEPDSGDGEHGEDCMCLIGVKGFQWQDYHCGEHMFFICEKSTTFAAPLVG